MRVGTSLIATVALCATAWATPDVSGTWMLKGFAKEGELRLTAQGQAIQADYDILVDDPSLHCEPASLSRVWANPNVSIALEQAGDRIRIAYEFFDLRREVPIGGRDVMSSDPSTRNVDGRWFAKMGSSFARYESDRLIIETHNHEPGYIRTSTGVPQSENTVSIEEFRLEGDTLHLRQTHIDETLFEVPFVVDYEFERIDAAGVPLYECTDADYDWFEQLNQ